jgi:TetR/AcrR family transcriptional regulator, regulator of autoinduction and epiphytic fitness
MQQRVDNPTFLSVPSVLESSVSAPANGGRGQREGGMALASVRQMDRGSADQSPRIDGRHARSARSKDHVVQAILELLREGSLRPSAQEIAARAGVSERTVFRHYADLDQLFAAAVAQQGRQIAPLLDLPPTAGPRPQRVAELVRRRARLFEEVTPVRRAAVRHAPFQAVVRQGLEQLHGVLRGQLETVFADEMDRVPPEQRRELVECVDVATSWAVWETLRADQGLGPGRAASAVERTVTSLLAAACGPDDR